MENFASKFVAIDPMALILTGEAYLIWTLIHHPDDPREIIKVFKGVDAAQKKGILQKATAYKKYAEKLNAAADLIIRAGAVK